LSSDRTAPARRAAPQSEASTPRSIVWRYRRILYLVTLLGFSAVAGALFLLAQVPLPPAAEQAQTTFLTDVNGQRLASIDGGEDRVPVALDTVPPIVVDAVLATEDRNFFTHGGLDPVGILRATFADLRGNNLQGGSTLTQQYVKQTFLESKERTVWRKLREAALAVKLERRYDKRQILERYLNTVYFGRGAYGVQAASRAYFNKDVTELDVGQAALLAGLIRSPERADPERNRDVATARRDRSLAALRATGRLSKADVERYRKMPLETVVLARAQREPDIVNVRSTGYFVEYVRAELVRRYGEAVTYQRGLRVKTTLDLGLQQQAYDAVYGTLDKPDDPSGALVSIDGEGRVRAMVGGRDFGVDKVNFAVGKAGGGSGRQAGSTFKPFLLAAAVKDGYSIQSTFPGPKSIILPKANEGKDYEVENYEDTDYGDSISLLDATVNSVNTVYVQAQLSLGADKVEAEAHELGVDSDLPSGAASLSLGTASVSPMEMAEAYSTFANRGVHVEPRTILEVRRSDGTVLEPARGPQENRVLDREDADVVTYALRQVVERGSGVNAKFGHPLAGKTGTTQDFGDAWFIGYTPKLTTAVWMGFPEGNTHKMTKVRGIKVNGGSFPARIFRRYMTEVGKDPQWIGDFPAVKSFPGKKLAPPKKGVLLPTTTTSSTSTTSTTAAASATSTTAPAATTTAPATTTTAKPAPATTTTTTAPPATTAPPTTAAPPPSG
jgi:penicillin-binding protein 1A